MTIPLSADSLFIDISEWLKIFSVEYGIALSSAQYVNIWDPIEQRYTDIAGLRSFPVNNLKTTSPIYIRYLPHQEAALPPHANYFTMMDDTQNHQFLFNNAAAAATATVNNSVTSATTNIFHSNHLTSQGYSPSSA